MNISRVLIASICLCALSTSIVIADEAPGPWEGPYLGIHGGYGWGENDFSRGLIPSGSYSGPDSEGGLYGLHAGFNWQHGAIVGGAEIDFSASEIDGAARTLRSGASTASEAERQEYLGSARARIGLSFDNILLFASGGLAWERLELISRDSNGSTFTRTSTSPNDRWGWVAGLGAELQLRDSWTLRGEYLHYDFGSISYSGAYVDPGLEVRSRAGDQTVDVFRTALSYHLHDQASSARQPANCCDKVWSGAYVGMHLGFAQSENDYDIPFGEFGSVSGSNPQGTLWGGLIGYNWQRGAIIAGLEADFSLGDLDGSSNQVVADAGDGFVFTSRRSESVDFLASIRPRLGITPWSSGLIYLTAGLAWERIEYSTTDSETEDGLGVRSTFRSPNSKFGWVAGIGAEAMLGDSGIIGRVEYLHYDFDQLLGTIVGVNNGEVFRYVGGNRQSTL